MEKNGAAFLVMAVIAFVIVMPNYVWGEQQFKQSDKETAEINRDEDDLRNGFTANAHYIGNVKKFRQGRNYI